MYIIETVTTLTLLTGLDLPNQGLMLAELSQGMLYLLLINDEMQY